MGMLSRGHRSRRSYETWLGFMMMMMMMMIQQEVGAYTTCNPPLLLSLPHHPHHHHQHGRRRQQQQQQQQQKQQQQSKSQSQQQRRRVLLQNHYTSPRQSSYCNDDNGICRTNSRTARTTTTTSKRRRTATLLFQGTSDEEKQKEVAVAPPQMETYSGKFLADNGLAIETDIEGRISARPSSMTITNVDTEEDQQQGEPQQQQQQQQQDKQQMVDATIGVSQKENTTTTATTTAPTAVNTPAEGKTTKATAATTKATTATTATAKATTQQTETSKQKQKKKKKKKRRGSNVETPKASTSPTTDKANATINVTTTLTTTASTNTNAPMSSPLPPNHHNHITNDSFQLIEDNNNMGNHTTKDAAENTNTTTAGTTTTTQSKTKTVVDHSSLQETRATTAVDDNNANNHRRTTPEMTLTTQQSPKRLKFKIHPKHSVTTVTPSNDASPTADTSGEKRLNIRSKPLVSEPSPQVVPTSGFNVVLTHCTADFDSLASAVGLAKLWSDDVNHRENTHHHHHHQQQQQQQENDDNHLTTTTDKFDSTSDVPTFVVLPRGAHPAVQRFLALHKHLFPIRSLKSLPNDLSGLNRLGLVDAQRRDRVGPAENLLSYAKRVTVVDHHIDTESDIPEATDYVVDKVGSVSTMIAERLKDAKMDLTEAEATLLALGIHADTGSLCFDSTTPRDAMALAWVMSQGASQAAIAEHAKSSLSLEQQGVLTQALINTNVTEVHGVSVSTVLLGANGFINGLAAVTQDALELSSSDIFLLSLVYEAEAGGRRRAKKKSQSKEHIGARLLSKIDHNSEIDTSSASIDQIMYAEAWMGGEEVLQRRRLKAAFDRIDADGSGYIEQHDMPSAITHSGIIATKQAVKECMKSIKTTNDSNDNSTATTDNDHDHNHNHNNHNGNNNDETIPSKINFEEFIAFADAVKKHQEEIEMKRTRNWTMIIIGRVKAGVHMKSVKLNKLLEKFGGGGHAKAASATIRLNTEAEAEGILQGVVNELIETSLQVQPTVGDFMTAPVLSVRPNMNEKQVEDLFTRYDVRALPVVDDNNDVIGLVTYKEVAAAKQRLWNKEQKRLKRERELQAKLANDPNANINPNTNPNAALHDQRAKRGSAVKGWMKQHVLTAEASKTMAEVQAILLETDVGCIPVVADGTQQLVGMVTRTDLLRQHRYYPSLHYHNKGFSDSIAARQPIIQLRRKLKKFDLENE